MIYVCMNVTFKNPIICMVDNDKTDRDFFFLTYGQEFKDPLTIYVMNHKNKCFFFLSFLLSFLLFFLAKNRTKRVYIKIMYVFGLMCYIIYDY